MATRFLLLGELWKDPQTHYPEFYDLERILKSDPESAHLDIFNPVRVIDTWPGFTSRKEPDRLARKKIMNFMIEKITEEDTVGFIILPGWKGSRGAAACYMLGRFYDKGMIGAFPRADGSYWIDELEGIHHPFEEGFTE